MRYIVFFLIILLLFIPIKIPLKIFFEENKLEIYIFSRLIFPVTKRVNSTPKRKEEEHKSKDKKIKKHKKPPLDLEDYITIGGSLIYKLYNYKFKPKLKIDININIGLEDAATTALICGSLYSVNPIIYYILLLIFKIPDFNFEVKPIYNKSVIKFYITSIIYVSLVKIIFMIIYLLISFIKEVRLIRSGLNYE